MLLFYVLYILYCISLYFCLMWRINFIILYSVAVCQMIIKDFDWLTDYHALKCPTCVLHASVFVCTPVYTYRYVYTCVFICVCMYGLVMLKHWTCCYRAVLTLTPSTCTDGQPHHTFIHQFIHSFIHSLIHSLLVQCLIQAALWCESCTTNWCVFSTHWCLYGVSYASWS